MRRKYKTYAFILIGAPLAFGLPTLLNNYFPNQLSAFTKICYLFPLIAILFGLIQLIKKSSHGIDTPKLSVYTPLKIAGVLLLLLCALLGQAGIFIQHAAGQGHIEALSKQHYMIDIFHQLRWHSLLWPWALVGVTTISFIARSKNEPMQPFSNSIPSFGMPIFRRLIRKACDGYIEMCTRLFVCLTLGIFLASLCLAVGHMSIRPMVGTLSFVFLLLMVYSKRFKTLENNITTYNISPTAIFACMLAFMFFIAMVVKLMIIILLNHGAQKPIILTSHQTPLIIHKQTWLMSWHLWFWSWWILVTPLAASCLAKLMRHQKSLMIFLVILGVGAIFTSLFTVLSPHTLAQLANLLLMPSVSIGLQGLAMLGLFLLFASINAHHIIWLGFVPSKTPKKLRVMKLRIMWALVAMAFGAMLLSGLQSILLIQMLVAIVSVVILLMATTLKHR